MTFTFEKNKLENYVGEDLLRLLKKHKMYVAGGTITSLFTNSEINDLDVYAPNEEAAMKFMSDIWDKGVNVVSVDMNGNLIFMLDIGRAVLIVTVRRY